MLNEQANEMTGCNLGLSAEIPPAQSKQLHPLPTPAAVEPRHPGAPHQKRKTAHVLLVPTFWRSEDQCWELQVQIKTGEQLGRPCWMCWGERLRQRIKEAAHVRRWVGEVGGAREVRGQV